MNWSLSRHPNNYIDAAILNYKELAAEAIEEWIDLVDPLKSINDEFVLEEFPSQEEAGIAFTNFRYKFHFSTSFGPYKLGEIPYNIKVERADWQPYMSEAPENFMERWNNRPRVRYIDVTRGII